MNAARPELGTTQPPSTLMKAAGGTVLVHGVIVLLLWLWPKPPLKPHEVLLDVDLTKDFPRPTEAPTTAPTAFPTTVPTAAPTSVPTPVPTRQPEPTPLPKLALKTRVAKSDKPIPVATPVPVATPKKVEIQPTPIPKPTSIPQLPKSQRSSSPAPPKSGAPSRSAPSAPSSGSLGRRFARNDTPDRETTRSAPSSGSNAGSNLRGRDEEAAATLPGLNLPRTRARRGANGAPTTARSSAPTQSKDGTELDIGPSRPALPSSSSRRASADFGNGSADDGALRTGGLPGATGTTSGGTAKFGRGADQASGDDIGGDSRGRGGLGGPGRGRRGTRLAGDPFAGGAPSQGLGRGSGNSPGDGSGRGPGSGPGNGSRYARRNFGGDGDDGMGPGGRDRGAGIGPGGTGPGGEGTGPGFGRGGSGETAGTGRERVRRVSNSRRGVESEDQIGRGIWGGFKIRFYQDKSDHPDTTDGVFAPGNPIDWPVFTKLVTTKTVPNLDYDWNVTPPVKGMKTTYWSLKATGRIFVPKDDTYEFSFDELDDAGSLVLDGKNIIKVWKVQKSSPSSGKMFLPRGAHDIQIEYVQGPATAASIKLSWSSTSFPKEIVGVYKAPGE